MTPTQQRVVLQHRVVVDEKSTEFISGSKGVPQGTILGPFLFFRYG